MNTNTDSENELSVEKTTAPSSFIRGLLDSLLKPKNHLSAVRRSFSSKSWSTRLSFLLIALAIISGFATYAALEEAPPFGDNPNAVIWLLNIDLIILLMLVTLIARRLVSIWSGRRQNLAGSRLHVRLVLIFSIMAALPAIIMAVFSAFFFHFGVQTWFSENVRTAVVESQAVAQAYLEEHQQLIRADTLAMANDIDRQSFLVMEDNQAFAQMLNTQSLFRNLSEAMIFDKSGKILARSGMTFTLTFETVPNFVLAQAENGEVVILSGDEDDRVRALVKLNNWNDSYLFVGRVVDPVVLSHVASTKDASERYAQLEGSYSGLQVTVTMIFVVVALLLLMAAIWVGIMLARQLVTPISTLISVSDRVRAGDLTARVPDQAQIEEFDYLAKSFNRMTNQIQEQRNELIMTNRQLDQRRRFTETVLAGVSAGIIGVNEEGNITLANSMAGELFGEDNRELIGKNLVNIIPEIALHLEKAYDSPSKIIQSEVPLITSDGKKLTLSVRIAIELIGDHGHGAVLTFDDITELQAAQRKAAWADVARRVAHEIKNPLTPIQLSAERLRKKYASEINNDPQTFEICVSTIIKHVEDIGRMVNEFSDFARLPESILRPEKLVSNLKDLVTFQKSAHSDIKFTMRGDGLKHKELILCDIQQIRQALTNILQNAIDSIDSKKTTDPKFNGKIDVLFTLSKKGELYVVVSDNGIGLPVNEPPDHLSEPYVTHRAKGTGLGLAIVKKIMQDHNGELIIGQNKRIKALDKWNDLKGAVVSLVLPLSHEETRYIGSDSKKILKSA